MSLTPSARLGRYEVTALAGVGGMGEVYKARDTRLDRTVAVKVLPRNVAENPELCQRFEREGRAISRLNHPNICRLYDVGNHEGTEYLVMEFLEGETLAKRLDRGRLPLPQVITIACEIARALDAAHQQGIVHRDLKPGNVMITRTGAKLLDFGLAKLRDPGAEVTNYLDDRVDHLGADTPGSASDAPTKAHPLTGVRTVLGTAQYMAPEQIEGHEADQRTDVFAFGVVLYEMATGKRAFGASSQARLIGEILAAEPPPMRQVDPSIPRALETLVSRCMAKDPDERWQHVRDLVWQAEAIAERFESERPRAARRTHALWALATLVVAVVTGVAVSSLARAPVAPVAAARLFMELSADAPLMPDQLSLALSPDGQRFVYRSGTAGATQLFLRAMSTGDVQPIPGTQNAHTPFFSPDGQSLGFLSGTTVQHVSLAGGRPLEMCEVPSLTPGSPGASWGENGTVVFAAGLGGLFVVPAAGGTPERLTTPDAARNEERHYGPQFLPGGDTLLFMIRLKGGAARVALLSIATRQWRVVEGITDVVGTAGTVSDGNRAYVVYAQRPKDSPISRLRAVEIDVARAVVRGGTLQLDTVWVQTGSTVAVAHFAVSASGTLAYVAGHTPGPLVRVSRDGGTVSALTTKAHAFRYPRVSPDGTTVAVVIEDVGGQVAIVETGSGLVRHLTNTGTNTHPTWMPDGSRLAIAAIRDGSDGYDVYALPIDESAGAALERIITRRGNQFPSGFSRQTNRLAFYELGDAGREILTWSPKEEPVKLVSTPGNNRLAVFSRDGGLIAYVSDQSGRDEIWMQKYSGSGGPIQISTDGGTEPVWSPSSDELFFRRRTELLSVRIGADGRPVGPASRVFDRPFELARPEVGRPNYDVFPDGRSFVMVSASDPHTRLPIAINWLDELRRQRR